MLNVLVIDDEPAILRSASQILKEYRFQPQTATDPFSHAILNHDCKSAEAPCKELKAIISDFNLKLGVGKTGLDFLKAFQQSSCGKKKDVKLILCSGDMPGEVALEASRLRIKLIHKPYDGIELVRAIGILP